MFRYLKEIFELLRDTAVDFGKDKCSLLAAALAYYTVFSIAPLLVIAVAVAGFVFSESAVQVLVMEQIEEFMGAQVASMIQSLIDSISSPGAGILATVISVVIALLGASGVFNQLKLALNTIWGIVPDPGRGLIGVVVTRTLSLSMVLGIGFLLLVSLVSSTIITFLGNYLLQLSPMFGAVLPRLEFVTSFLLMTFLFAIIFKALPDAKVAWRDVWLGAVVTAVLFSLGEYAIGLYISQGSVGSAYGAAGSLVVILVWIYYSAQILLFGAEFTKVYANKHGHKIIPRGNGMLVTVKKYEVAPEPAPLIEPMEMPETADPPRRQLQKQFATALIGLAVGLLLGFLASLRRNR